MKKLIASVAVLIALTFYLASCEKDDICAEGTPTTPGLIVEFYDKDNTTELKNISNLQYYVLGHDDIDTLTSGSKLELPLRTDANSVKWALKYTASIGGQVYQNTDFLEFRYTHDELYVSRACGYKSIFQLDQGNSLDPNPRHTDNTASDGLWIDRIDVINSNIENEDTTHVKIFF